MVCLCIFPFSQLATPFTLNDPARCPKRRFIHPRRLNHSLPSLSLDFPSLFIDHKSIAIVQNQRYMWSSFFLHTKQNYIYRNLYVAHTFPARCEERDVVEFSKTTGGSLMTIDIENIIPTHTRARASLHIMLVALSDDDNCKN